MKYWVNAFGHFIFCVTDVDLKTAKYGRLADIFNPPIQRDGVCSVCCVAKYVRLFVRFLVGQIGQRPQSTKK